MQSTFRKSEKHAFILSSDDISKIWKKLESFNKSVTASVSFNDSIVRNVESLSELLNFENSKSRKILRIELQAVSSDRTNITRVSFDDDQYNTVLISSSGADDVVSKVAHDISEIVNGLRPWYSRICRIDIGLLLISLLTVGFLIVTLMTPEPEKKKVLTFVETVKLIGLTTIFLLSLYYIHKAISVLKMKIFPIATFSIGQGLQRYKIHENIRWGVVIAFVVSMASSFVYSLIT